MAWTAESGGILVDFRPMSPEEIERTVQFLLNQQAQFAADFAASQTRQEAIEAIVERLSNKTDRIAEGLIGLTSIVGQLAATQQLTAEEVRTTGEQQKETDRLLRQLIRTFEQHLRDDHGQTPM